MLQEKFLTSLKQLTKWLNKYPISTKQSIPSYGLFFCIFLLSLFYAKSILENILLNLCNKSISTGRELSYRSNCMKTLVLRSCVIRTLCTITFFIPSESALLLYDSSLPVVSSTLIQIKKYIFICAFTICTNLV